MTHIRVDSFRRCFPRSPGHFSTLFYTLAEFERNLIGERTRAGLDAARARGRKGGRPEALDAEKRKLLIDLYEQKKTPVNTLCEMMGISKPTLYAYVKKEKDR